MRGMATVSDRNGSPDTRQTFLYFGCLTLLVYLETTEPNRIIAESVSLLDNVDRTPQ